MSAAGKFTSGTLLPDGRLTLVRENGSTASCGVLMFLGTLSANEDGTCDLELGSP